MPKTTTKRLRLIIDMTPQATIRRLVVIFADRGYSAERWVLQWAFEHWGQWWVNQTGEFREFDDLSDGDIFEGMRGYLEEDD